MLNKNQYDCLVKLHWKNKQIIHMCTTNVQIIHPIKTVQRYIGVKYIWKRVNS